MTVIIKILIKNSNHHIILMMLSYIHTYINTSYIAATNNKDNAQSQTKWTLNELAHNLPPEACWSISLGLCALILCSKQTIQLERSAPVSHLSLAPALHGTPIR